MNRFGSDKSYHYLVFVVVIILLFPTNCFSQINKDMNQANKHLSHDPVFDGDADLAVVKKSSVTRVEKRNPCCRAGIY